MKLRVSIFYLLVLVLIVGLSVDKTFATDQDMHLKKEKTSKQYRPKAGYWEGSPSVSFKVTDDGDISYFKIGYSVGTKTCNIKTDKIVVVKDGGFGVKSFIPDKDYKFPENIPKEEKDMLYRPRAVTIGKDKMVEIRSITGIFNSATAVMGRLKVLVCDDYHQYLFKNSDEVLQGREWSAKWKGPK